jgi:uncharacterized protein YprB with RNaseH-like and TPR domain
MSALSDKLKSLGVQVGARNLPQQPKRLPKACPIEQVVEGRFLNTSFGPAFVTETKYGSNYQHGQIGLRPKTSLDAVAAWAGEARIADCRLEQFVFLDTETSGLAGGSGTYTFLIGTGRFENNEFRLAQFFMRDPGEERAQLAALTEFLEPCQVLVTFNGKAFDAPLVNSRYTVNGLDTPLPQMAHLDLLPLARRLWRDRLPSRRLGNLEAQILGAERTQEDVPGWLIPSLYFDYLRHGDARPLKGVFYHNELDVLAMAALLNHMGQMLADPLGTAVEYALDLVAIGKLHEAMGQIESAVELLKEGMTRNDLPEEHYWEAQRRLSFLHKRHGRLDEAVHVWKLAAEGRRIYAHVELAKFYEHKQRDYHEAALWTQTALDILTTPSASGRDRREWLSDLKHRLARLQRKIERNL